MSAAAYHCCIAGNLDAAWRRNGAPPRRAEGRRSGYAALPAQRRRRRRKMRARQEWAAESREAIRPKLLEPRRSRASEASMECSLMRRPQFMPQILRMAWNPSASRGSAARPERVPRRRSARHRHALSARHSVMATESHTVVVPSTRQGTLPVGENGREGVRDSAYRQEGTRISRNGMFSSRINATVATTRRSSSCCRCTGRAWGSILSTVSNPARRFMHSRKRAPRAPCVARREHATTGGAG